MGSKIIYVLGGMILLNLTLLIFSCSAWDTTTGQCIGSETVGTTSTNTSSLISFMSSPSETSGSGIWQTLFGSAWGLLAAVAVGAITVGALLIRNEAPIWIAMAIGLTSTVYPAIKLWQLVNGLSMVGDSLSRMVIAIVLVSIMVLTVIFTIVDWARGTE